MTARRLQPAKQLSSAAPSTATPRERSAPGGGGTSVVGIVSSSVSHTDRTSAVIVARSARGKYGCQPRPAGIGASLSFVRVSVTVRLVGVRAKRCVAR